MRIGRTEISKATLDHWVHVIRRGGGFGGFRGEALTGAPRQRALALLISSNWLIGEAARRGLAVSNGTVEQALAERTAADNGAGLQRRVRLSGQTIADVKLELRSEMAAEAIRGHLASRAVQITPQEVAAFYAKNRGLFHTPEERVVEVIERLPSRSAAVALAVHIGAGPGFARRAFREQISRAHDLTVAREKEAILNAIFTARPGVVGQPILFNGAWALFVVRKVIPPHSESLATARREVVARVSVSRQRAIASRFDHEYREFWGARTHCIQGYVGPGCPKYVGRLGPYEDPFPSSAHPLLSETASRP